MARKREGFVPIGDLVIDLPGVPMSSAPRRNATGWKVSGAGNEGLSAGENGMF